MSQTISLREIAHARSGEKGRHANIAVIAYHESDYDLLKEQVTEAAVARLYGAVALGGVERFEAPAIGALNFVLHDALDGGRSRTIAFEESGKALSSLILSLPMTVADDYVGRAAQVALNGFERGGIGAAEAAGQATDRHAKDAVRLGSATGWSRDRYEPALALIERGDVDYLGFDSMSEITMSAAQVARGADPTLPGYDPSLETRLAPLLKPAMDRGVRLVTNQGWLDPVAAAQRIVELAESQGIKGLKVAAVTGGQLTDQIADMGLNFVETGEPVAARRDQLLSAETYLGARTIARALDEGAHIVITTRIADACVYLGPLMHEFNWAADDVQAMARGMVIGHLMECGCQVSGGYFADPGYKNVPDLHNVGNPIAEVSADRTLITKLANTGGLVSPATCKEQLLYEVQDPANYLCPDVVADFTRVRFEQAGPDRVEVFVDQAGKPAPPTLKALIGLREGFMTEEMVLFAGPGAAGRAALTEQVLRKRFEMIQLEAEQIRFDHLGVNSVHREASPAGPDDPYEVILRIAVKTRTREQAEKLRLEIDPMAVNGVAGTGKWATSSQGSRLQAIVGLDSALVPREAATETLHWFSS